jgi:transcriptional regulator with XRE-family HTH domain
MNIGNKLKSLRVEKGYESVLMADKLGISETTYRRYERNESAPDINMLEKIAKVYDIELFDLLKDDKLVFNQQNKKGDNNGLVINQLSEKLIEQYEIRLKEKDEMILELKAKLKKLEDL